MDGESTLSPSIFSLRAAREKCCDKRRRSRKSASASSSDARSARPLAPPFCKSPTIPRKGAEAMAHADNRDHVFSLTDAEWSAWLEEIIERALEHSVLRTIQSGLTPFKPG